MKEYCSPAKENLESQKGLDALLEKQCGFYRVILELARSEKDAYLAKKPLSEILPIMKKKQILLQCIEDLEEDLRPLKEAAEESRAALRGNLLQAKKLLKEILIIDQENQASLLIYMKGLEEKKVEEEASILGEEKEGADSR